MKIQARRVTSQNFAKFGKVVSTPTGEPTSQRPDYKFWSDIADYLIEGETEIGICTVYAQAAREISGVERHLRTPEILIPIDAPFILPVLLDGEDVSNVEAFQVNPGEVVIIDKGVWHAACLPAGKAESSYFVIFRKNTPYEDVVKKDIQKVEIAPSEMH